MTTVFVLVVVLIGLLTAVTGSAAAQSAGFVDVDASDLEGSGTGDDPYIITNASELQAMEDDLDAYYELGRDINASSTAIGTIKMGIIELIMCTVCPVTTNSPMVQTVAITASNIAGATSIAFRKKIHIRMKMMSMARGAEMAICLNI